MTPSRDPAAARAERSGPVRGGAQIAVAMGVMNLCTYGYTILAARLLGPVQYGGFAAAMNLLLVVSVIALGFQATAARRISADLARVGQIERGVLRVSWQTAIGSGVVLLLLTPVIDRVLRLDSLPAAALIALTTVPLTVMGGQAGVLQGERRWAALGAVYVAGGLPRLVIGTALLVWRPDQFVALLAVAVTSVAPVAVGWWALRHEREPGAHAEAHGGRALLVEALANSQALLAFFALSNLDIVVARNTLAPEESGLYAGGLILTKAMLFLPQFVVVVAFPALATETQRVSALARGIGAIAGLGAVGILGCWLLPEVALVFIGGEEFAELTDRLWLYALLGTVLAALQLLVYSVLARQGRRSSLLVWAALLAMLGAGATAETLTGLVWRVLTVDAVLLVVLLGLSLWLARRDRTLSEPPRASSGPSRSRRRAGR